MVEKTELMRFWKENLGLTELELNAFREIKSEDFVKENFKAKGSGIF